MPAFNTVDEYIDSFPDETKKRLEQVREVIRKVVPEAEEGFSYGVPAFKYKVNTMIYAEFKNHIGLYPTPPVIEKFSEELKGYETSKGAIKFPHSKPLPLTLITRIIEYKMKKS